MAATQEERLRELVENWKRLADAMDDGTHVTECSRRACDFRSRASEVEQALSAAPPTCECGQVKEFLCAECYGKGVSEVVRKAAAAPSPLTPAQVTHYRKSIKEICFQAHSKGWEWAEERLLEVVNPLLAASPAEQPESWLEKQRKKVPLSSYSGPAEQPCICDDTLHKNVPCPLHTPAGEEPSESGWTLGATEFHSDKPPITEQEVVRYSQNDLDAAVRRARLDMLELVCQNVTLEPVYPHAQRRGIRICGFAIKGKNCKTGAKTARRAERLKAAIRALERPHD